MLVRPLSVCISVVWHNTYILYSSVAIYGDDTRDEQQKSNPDWGRRRSEMRVSEVRQIHYCSFCSDSKRTEATGVCSMCGDDICSDHRFTVGVTRKGLVEAATPPARSRVPDFIRFRLVSICPTCAGESVHTVIKVLTARGGWS